MAGQKQRPPGHKDANYFCEYCQVWMANHAAVKQKHENGGKHKAAVAAKIRGMKEKEKAASREAAHNKAAMEAIEREAAEKYQESDRARETKGTWEFQESTGYYYNAVHRHYYDTASKMYYGGTPPAWTDSPDIPAVARFGGGGMGQVDPLLAGTGVSKYPKGMKVGDVSHPQAGIGKVEGFKVSGGVKKFVAIPGRTLTKRQQQEVEFQKKRDAARRWVLDSDCRAPTPSLSLSPYLPLYFSLARCASLDRQARPKARRCELRI